MVPDSVVILPTCGNKEVHATHSWRHGFLHLRKEICDGFTMPAWIAYNNEMRKRWEYLNKRKPQKFPISPNHRHFFQTDILAASGDDIYLQWHCYCGAKCERHRDRFYTSMYTARKPWQSS